MGLAAVGVAGAIALHIRDPHQSGSWGYCPLYLLTGHYCPGCGALRGVNDLTNLDFVGAASSNLLLVAVLPFALFFWFRWVRAGWAHQDRPAVAVSIPLVLMILGTTVLFTVVRNLAFGSWLAP